MDKKRSTKTVTHIMCENASGRTLYRGDVVKIAIVDEEWRAVADVGQDGFRAKVTSEATMPGRIVRAEYT